MLGVAFLDKYIFNRKTTVPGSAAHLANVVIEHICCSGNFNSAG